MVPILGGKYISYIILIVVAKSLSNTIPSAKVTAQDLFICPVLHVMGGYVLHMSYFLAQSTLDHTANSLQICWWK